MRIKKFTCINCGAPKVNEYNSPYIVCDYCGSFTDIDFTIGMNFWNASPSTTMNYQFNKINFAVRMQNALASGDKNDYRILQREYWDFYYRSFPAYLPPSINTAEKYKLYLDVCAVSSTNYAFDKSNTEKNIELNRLQQSVIYRNTPQGTKADAESFFKMSDYFISITRDSFKDFYDNPEFAIMHELLPEPVHLKMKLSMFIQAWIPYLDEETVDKLLRQTGFSLQYTEITKPKGENGNCEHCGGEVFFPEGSYKVYCENCHKINTVKKKFQCMSCGAENSVPDNPAKPIDCEFCGVENRLIQPHFSS